MIDNKLELTPELENILNNIKIDSNYSSSKLVNKYINLEEYQQLMKKITQQGKSLELQIENIRKNNLQLDNDQFLKNILNNYGKNIINIIKEEYKSKLNQNTVDKLDKFTIEVINDPNERGDITAHSDTSTITINFANFETNIEKIETKIVKAMGSLPHEIFHFIYKMLKEPDNIKEIMIFNLKDGDQAIVKGMIGHMLNEGFVEKLSQDFCIKNNIYSTPNPSYIQFTKLCDYIMKHKNNITEEFLMNCDYEDILNLFSNETKKVYEDTERYEYANRFKLRTNSGEKRYINQDEIINSFNNQSKKNNNDEIFFDQRTNEEIEIANEIREKNKLIREYKELYGEELNMSAKSIKGSINFITLVLIMTIITSIVSLIILLTR